MKARRMWTLALALAPLLLVACTTAYQPGTNGSLALVRFVELQRPTLCIDKKAHSLNPDASGYAVIPAGQVIHLVAHHRTNTGYCFPAVRFTPQAGQRYQLMIETKEERCFSTVLREDSSAQHGVRVDPTMAPAPGSCGMDLNSWRHPPQP